MDENRNSWTDKGQERKSVLIFEESKLASTSPPQLVLDGLGNLYMF